MNMAESKLHPVPPFRVIVRDTRETDLYGGVEAPLDNLSYGLVWAADVPSSLCALAGQALAKISAAHPWEYVAEMAAYALIELDAAARAGAEAETEFLRALLKRVKARASSDSSFEPWHYIAMNGGPAAVLARTLIWTVRNADEPAKLMHPVVPPEGATGVDIMSAYALLLFDRAASAWTGGDLRGAFDHMAEGSLALSYATLDEGNILASRAAADAEHARLSELQQERVNRAKSGADALHSKPGGSRDKREAIRRAWATGKYSSRDICAEQEAGAHGMSFSAARKALRNTPEPGSTP